MSDNAEAPAGPDIVEWLAAAASTITGVSTLAACDAQEKLRAARRSIEYLRDANGRLIAENTTLRMEATRDRAEISFLKALAADDVTKMNAMAAELRAARGEQGR